MPRANLAPTVTERDGIVLAAETNGDVTNGHSIVNSGKTLLLVRNNHGSTAYNVTVHIRATVEGKDIPEQIVSIPATQSWIFGPYDTTNYGSEIYVDVANAELKLRAIEPGVY